MGENNVSPKFLKTDFDTEEEPGCQIFKGAFVSSTAGEHQRWVAGLFFSIFLKVRLDIQKFISFYTKQLIQWNDRSKSFFHLFKETKISAVIYREESVKMEVS